MADNIVRNNNNNNNNNNKRKKKLSKWMKKIIQPARDIQTQSHPQPQPQPNRKETKVQWDQEPQRTKTNHKTNISDIHIPNYKYIDSDDDDDEESEDSDHASMAPLFSFCSSSVKSSTFSDMHSMQSTRPTVMSTRTVETNSSTMAIPPASILDRARIGPSSSLSHTSNTPSIISSRPSSSKHFSLQRYNSSHTVNSIVTIKS